MIGYEVCKSDEWIPGADLPNGGNDVALFGGSGGVLSV